MVLCAALAPPATLEARVAEIDRIVAIVNDDVIVMSELEARLREVRAQIAESGAAAPPYQVLEKQVLERLIMDRLQLQMADQLGIRIDDEQLNQTIAGMARQNGLTLRQFRDILRRDGYDFAAFREQVRDQLRIAEVRRRQVSDRITVSEREIENFLAMQERQGLPGREYRLRHILVGLPPGASAEERVAAEGRARAVMAELAAGASFGEVAIGVSDGRQALQGGDLGWIPAAELPGIFAPIVPNMEPGDVRGPIESPGGFHIIELAQVRGEDRHIVTQTLVRHILVRPNELVSDDDARTRLEQLKLRIEAGEDFPALARSHSDDRATAIKGGEIGWMSPGDLVPRFEQVMNALAPGEVSDPFRTQFGWHIVQVVERRQHDSTEEKLRSYARERIRERKVEEEGQAWLRQLRDQAYVEYRLGEQ